MAHWLELHLQVGDGANYRSRDVGHTQKETVDHLLGSVGDGELVRGISVFAIGGERRTWALGVADVELSVH